MDAAAEEPVARHLAFGTQPRQDGNQQTVKGEPILLNVDGRHWPQLAGARGAGRQQNFLDPNFDEPLYQQAYGLHQVMDKKRS